VPKRNKRWDAPGRYWKPPKPPQLQRGTQYGRGLAARSIGGIWGLFWGCNHCSQGRCHSVLGSAWGAWNHWSAAPAIDQQSYCTCRPARKFHDLICREQPLYIVQCVKRRRLVHAAGIRPLSSTGLAPLVGGSKRGNEPLSPQLPKTRWKFGWPAKPGATDEATRNAYELFFISA
jgi:hypothetical protein